MFRKGGGFRHPDPGKVWVGGIEGVVVEGLGGVDYRSARDGQGVLVGRGVRGEQADREGECDGDG